jgi:O-antigen/teichoic acid export membrane protein
MLAVPRPPGSARRRAGGPRRRGSGAVRRRGRLIKPELGTTAVRPAPAVDLAPPVTPNLARRPELAAAQRVGRNTIETILFRGITTPTALLFVIVQSRLLEPTGRGEFVVVVLGATIVSRLLGQLGIAVTSLRRHSPLEESALTRRCLGLGVALSLIAAPAMAAITVASGQVGWKLAAIGAAGIVPNVLWQTVSGVLLGQGEIRVWNILQLLQPLLSLAALVLLCWVLDTGVAGALAGWAFAHVVAAAFALAVIRRLWWPPSLPRLIDEASRAIVRLAVVMGAVQVVNLISYRAELFILGREDGNDAVGVYSIALQAVESMWLVPAALATAVTAPAVAAPDDGDAAALIRRSSLRAFVLAGVVAAVVGALAPFVIPAVFGDEFKGAVRPLELLLPGVAIYAPVTVLVVYLSVRRGRPWTSLAVAVVAMLVTIAAAVLLIPRYGASGAAVASSIGYGAGAALAWAFFVGLARRSKGMVPALT